MSYIVLSSPRYRGLCFFVSYYNLFVYSLCYTGGVIFLSAYICMVNDAVSFLCCSVLLYVFIAKVIEHRDGRGLSE